MNYNINLNIFEGPLDLLYHLIRKNDLNIYDIPMALILDQYLEYLEMMKDLDIDLAGEFIFMASELSHIKSRMLLHKKMDEEEEEADPRADLVKRLLEYQRYKLAANWLTERPILFRDVFKRVEIEKPEELHEEEVSFEVEPYTLLSTFHEILKKAPKGAVHSITAERVSVTERIYQIVERLKVEESALFESLFAADNGRSDLVVTFLAILEMTKLRMIFLYQMDRFGPIRVKRRMEVIEAISTELM